MIETPKIFGIGFQKTGTSSLGRALEHLGFSVGNGFSAEPPDIERKILERAEEMLPRYDAFQDTPWPLLYQFLDQRVPGSKFILTVRNPERWLKSVTSHFGPLDLPIHEWIYGHGSPTGHEEAWLARYVRHNEEVQAYFAVRSEDLLVMDFEKGDGWEALCKFLGKPVPNIRFPVKNTATDRKIRQVRRSVQRLLGIEGLMRRLHVRRRVARGRTINQDDAI